MTPLLLSLALLTATDAPLGPDKGAHLTVGLSLGASSYAVSRAYLPHANAHVVSLVVVLGVATGKEAWDLTTGLGTPSALDWLWTVLGGLAGQALAMGVDAVFSGGGP